ncbi:MAG: hypothetical protein LBS81_03195 [Endomicrobium sp.]|jgi:hypothetical protein|nr:hypothetical protein [Endomicrobium sp.]
MCRDLNKVLKYVEPEELAADLSLFISKAMEKELTASNNMANLVKSLDRQKIKSDNTITKITCSDFIIGETFKLPKDNFRDQKL